MRLLGLLGTAEAGVTASPSPAMYRAAFAAVGLDAVYEAFSVEPGDLADALRGARALGFLGFNVTIPHKQAVVPLLDAVSEAARLIGAVNVIVREAPAARGASARLVGHNTDWLGLRQALLEGGAVVEGSRACVVGSGGAARAAVYALASQGASEVCVVARNGAAARGLEAVAESARGTRGGAVRPAFGVRAVPPGARDFSRCFLSEVEAALAEFDIVVASLPGRAWAELLCGAPATAAPRATASSSRGPVVAMDMVYSPAGRTRFTDLAHRVLGHGSTAFDGAAMLLWQAVESFRLWTGLEPPVAEMREALCRALGRRNLV